MIVLAGALLLGVEVFVLPGFGIAGISAIIVLALGLVLSFQDFVLPDPALPWEGRLMLKNLGRVMGSALGALLVSVLMVRYVLPGLSGSGKGPYLTATLGDSHADSKEALTVMPGQTGQALTQLRPAGKIRIREKKVDAITQGEFIGSGTDVRVVAVEQNRVVVEKMGEEI